MEVRKLISSIRQQLDQLEAAVSGPPAGPERPGMGGMTQRMPMGAGGPNGVGMPVGNNKASRLLGV